LAVVESLGKTKIEDRVVDPTLRILNMLDRTNNKATFFVLGEVAAKFPELVAEMAKRGHEVASHGYHHNLVYNYTRYQFETDISRGIEALESAANQKVLGYRAPSWSLSAHQTPWAWEVLHSFGFKYDSSLYPYKTFLFGDSNAPRFDYEIPINDGQKLREIPPSVAEFFGKRLPFSGGFFMRVAPLHYIQHCIRQYNENGKAAVIYLHPWEIDVDQPRLPVSLKNKFILYANLKRTENKLLKLLQRFRFVAIRDFLMQEESSTKLSATRIPVQ
jgi:polysaccharide deacetylase family protein (PEP-CTERM system associated)